MRLILIFHYFFLVSCNEGEDYMKSWEFNHSKSEHRQSYQNYLKSNDIINLSIEKPASEDSEGPDVKLRSHDIQFTIRNDTFQEVVCHNERLGGNDEVNSK